jgi:hypothetical protein
MPRKSKRPKAKVVPRQVKKLTEERPVAPSFNRLVMEERDRLREILNDPVFIKAWKNAELSKPSAFPPMRDHFEGQFGDARASHRLHQIQGWEMFKAALIRETLEIVPKPKASSEEYPDTATLENEIAKNLNHKKK